MNMIPIDAILSALDRGYKVFTFLHTHKLLRLILRSIIDPIKTNDRLTTRITIINFIFSLAIVFLSLTMRNAIANIVVKS